MAITQATLAEEVLSSAERAVARGINRAAQLAEVLNALNRANDAVSAVRRLSANTDEHHRRLQAYLTKRIEAVLGSTKTPAQISLPDTPTTASIT